MDRWRGRVGVVTGASEGIGEAIVRALAQNGMKVVALARREQMLKKLEDELTAKKFYVRTHVCDVTNDQQVKEAFEWVEKVIGPVSVLVNNAGSCQMTSLTEPNIGYIRTTIDTNLTGVLETTTYGMRSMKKNNIKDGHVIFINSLTGHQDLRIGGLGVYTATKHGVTILSRSMKRELKEEKSKIRVTSISPGLIRTTMTDWFTKDHVEEPVLEPKDVAETVVYALSVPANVNVSELTIEPV